MRLEALRKDSIYLKKDSKKEEVLMLVNDISVLASDIRSNENYFFGKNESETSDAAVNRVNFCSRKRQIASLQAIDLKRKAQEIINFLSK